MKRIAAATALMAFTVTVTACTSEAEPVGEGAPPSYGKLADFRGQLAGTDFECVRWETSGATIASCGTEELGSQVVQFVSDGELFAAMLVDEYPDVPGVVWGDGWVVKCHRWAGESGCEELGDVLGGRIAYQYQTSQ